MQDTVPVITIDGPSGTGKGTLAHRLACHLQWHILDSGALYRIVAVGAQAQGIPEHATDKLCEFASTMQVSFSSAFEGSIHLNGKEISSIVRMEKSGDAASIIATQAPLRTALLQRQYDFRQPPGLVADGRDMGTVVFPDAVLKFFLTASAEERAERRYKQLKNKGVSVNLAFLLDDIKARDDRDSSRLVAPLLPAKDAVIVDTTSLDVDAVFVELLQKVRQKIPHVM
jgi:cytidylate kinase